MKPEVLEGENQYDCATCGCKQDAMKGQRFKRFPYVLSLQSVTLRTFATRSCHRCNSWLRLFATLGCHRCNRYLRLFATFGCDMQQRCADRWHCLLPFPCCVLATLPVLASTALCALPVGVVLGYSPMHCLALASKAARGPSTMLYCECPH